MPLFEGHHDSGLQRLFIEMPDDAKDKVAWKWPDQQIVQYSQLNVDLDYQAVFTNLGRVIGVMGPGRYKLDEGASLALGWLVDHLTGNAYYDAEVYFVATRDIPNIEFGGPVDNLTDGPSGLVVTVRVFGELAFKVTDPTKLLAKLVGTGADGDFDAEIATWVKDQTLAAIRAVLPDLVEKHGVLAMGQLQESTSEAALAKVNEKLAEYGISVSSFAELNVNLPDSDARADQAARRDEGLHGRRGILRQRGARRGGARDRAGRGERQRRRTAGCGGGDDDGNADGARRARRARCTCDRTRGCGAGGHRRRRHPTRGGPDERACDGGPFARVGADCAVADGQRQRRGTGGIDGGRRAGSALLQPMRRLAYAWHALLPELRRSGVR